MTRFRRLPVAFAVAALLGVAAPAAASAASTLTISGATASYPLIQLLAQKYQKLHPHKIKFKIAQGGATVGENDVIAGRVSIGDLSRGPLSTTPAGLVFYPIAKYPICVITNKANTLANLTGTQLTQIFNGKVKTWSQVPGASVSGSIEPITRTSVAGVLTSFQELLLSPLKAGEKTSVSTKLNFPEEATEGQMLQKVASNPLSIGFVSGYQADKGTVNAVGYNGVACNLANATAGEYTGVAHFYEVTKGKATGAASAFIGWIKVSAAAKKIIETQWIPISG
jgi:phosphate transport system substrate-binding protein